MLILIAAAAVSGFLGDVESAVVILIVITMNAILGTVQTVKAERSLSSLKALSGPEAKVLRKGAVTPLPTREITVGDLVLLEAGDVIPADGRLLECHSLKVDESALTGESLGVEKQIEAIEGEAPWGTGPTSSTRAALSPTAGAPIWSPAPAWTPKWARSPAFSSPPPSRKRPSSGAWTSLVGGSR